LISSTNTTHVISVSSMIYFNNFYAIVCSLRLCSASSGVVSKVISHCPHVNDLLVLVLSGPGGDFDDILY